MRGAIPTGENANTTGESPKRIGATNDHLARSSIAQREMISSSQSHGLVAPLMGITPKALYVSGIRASVRRGSIRERP